MIKGKSINYLTLFGNPLQEAKARHLFVNEIPGLMLMDDKVVKLEERNQEMVIKETPSEILSFPLIGEHNQENTEVILENVARELSIVRNCYLSANPLIKIQRWWRHLCRSKGRKWKIVSLPRQEREELPSAFIEHRKQLDRLITEKMDISRSPEEVVSAVLHTNWEFWEALKGVIGEGQVYLSRQYCLANAIDFGEIEQFKILRPFGEI